MLLINAVMEFCLLEEVGYCCIAINPKQEKIYEGFGFKRVSSKEGNYYGLNNAPVALMVIDVIEEKKRREKNSLQKIGSMDGFFF